MGYPHGSAQSRPIWDQYAVYMGIPIWACPVTPHMGPIKGLYMGIPKWDCPVTPHMGPIWGLYGHAHLGLPSHTPYGTNMGFIWASPSGLAQL